MRVPCGLGVVALSTLCAACGEGRRARPPSDTPRPVESPSGEDPRWSRTLTVEIDWDTVSYSGLGVQVGGGNIHEAERLAARADGVVLKVNATSNRATMNRLIDAFTKSHGFWHEILVKRLDPDAEYDKLHATLALDKQVYSDTEPVELTLTIAPNLFLALFTPERIRVQDETGEDVNIFLRPLGSWGQPRFNCESTQKIDLTSFVMPDQRWEYVHRFAPGKYAATFHFSVDYPEWKEPFAGKEELGPRVWGPKKSNTVSFEVRASPGPVPDTDALLNRASALAEEKRWDEAVSACKRAVLSTTDLAYIREAIGRIARFSSRERGEEELDPARIDVATLRLGLLHASERARRAFCERYVRAWDDMVAGEKDVDDILDFPLRELFRYPQFRTILDEKVSRPEDCHYVYAEQYVGLPEEKDPSVMAGFLPRYPGLVLDYYAWYKAPLEIVPLLPGYFENDTMIWEGGPGEWYCGDAAFMALERAAGLDLGYSDQHDRIPDREQIGDLMRGWWWRYRHRFGVTPSAGPEVVSARIAAMKKADEVWAVSVEGVKPEEGGGRSIHLGIDHTIKGRLRNWSLTVHEGPREAKLPLRRGMHMVACVTLVGSPGGPREYRIVGPHGLWVIGE